MPRHGLPPPVPQLRRVAADRAIPDRLRLRLRRAGRFVYVDLATDVVEVPEIVPSGLVFTAPGIGPAAAGRMIRRVRTHPILEGARGGEPADLDGIGQCLVRLGYLV